MIYAGDATPPGDCRIIDARALADSGAIALYDDADGPRVVTVRDTVGRRPWNAQ